MGVEFKIIDIDGKAAITSDGYEDYDLALSVAGADVLRFKKFGSYQGDWAALVRVNGDEFWIHGAYGSCSGCDQFEAECDTIYSDDYKSHGYDYDAVLALGRDLLESEHLTLEGIVKEFGRNADWDLDAQEAIDWLNGSGE